MINNLKRLWVHIDSKRRLQFCLLFLLMVIASFAEVLSIGAVLPFLGVLAAPEQIYQHEYASFIIEYFEIADPSGLLFPLTVLFISAAVFSGVSRLALLWVQTRLSFSIGADFSYSIYRRTLYQPYSVHLDRNSSEVITGILTKSKSLVGGIIMPVMVILSSSLMMMTILAALIIVEPVIALGSLGGVGVIYLLIVALTKKQLIANSHKIATESNQCTKALQEGMGGIRDVLLDGSQDIYCDIFKKSDSPLRRAQANVAIIGGSPRFVIESLGMVLIAVIAYFLATKPGEGIVSAIPMLGALALSAQRMLPMLQQAYSSWSAIRGGQAVLMDSLALLDQPLPTNGVSDGKSLEFTKEINLDCLEFRYKPDLPCVIDGFSLVIKKGERVGIIGSTGSGKSTLLDLVMGLLEPTQGKMTVDGTPITVENQREWQKHIAHVPQAIFLSDSSVAENIAFGVPKLDINMDRVRQVAAQAQISEAIESLDEGYDSFVGERGVRLSGGQRQRLGIARALYKNADFIVFDEATSALDNETERSVMHSIEQLGEDLTVVIVAHRLSTLKKCDTIVELASGKAMRVGSYDEVISDAS